jgi:hypothetical protein
MPIHIADFRPRIYIFHYYPRIPKGETPMKRTILYLAYVFVFHITIAFGDPDAMDSAAETTAGNKAAAQSEIRDPTEQNRSYYEPQRNFSDPGTMEVGGNIAVNTLNSGGITSNYFTLDPLVNVFLGYFFFIGPITTYSGAWTGGSDQTELKLGLRAGFVFHPAGNYYWFINVGSGFAYESQSISDYNSGYDSWTGYYQGRRDTTFTGTTVPIFFNVKLAVQKHISINTGISGYITTINKQTQTQFLLGWGITGLIF